MYYQQLQQTSEDNPSKAATPIKKLAYLKKNIIHIFNTCSNWLKLIFDLINYHVCIHYNFIII